MQMEIDILKETIKVLKKDPGIDQVALKNREKAVIIDAMKSKYPLPGLLKQLGLSKKQLLLSAMVNTKRIKTSLGNMSPWEYRQNLGMVA